MIFALLVVLAFVFYVLNPEERTRVLRPIRRWGSYAGHSAAAGARAIGVFVRALRARRPWAVATLGAVAVLAVVVLINQRTLRQLADVRPEIERLIAVEERTKKAYEAAVAQFRLGAQTSEALVQTINSRIVPELQAVRLRLMAVGEVREEQAEALTRAREYVRLRDESWRLRSQALEQRNLPALKRADTAERASLAAFDAVVQASKSL